MLFDTKENNNKYKTREEWRIELRIDIIIEMLSILGDTDEMNKILIITNMYKSAKITCSLSFLKSQCPREIVELIKENTSQLKKFKRMY